MKHALAACIVVSAVLMPHVARAQAGPQGQPETQSQQPLPLLPPLDASSLTHRFRLSPPFADPDFSDTPVLPPDKNYWIPLGEVVGIDLAIWGYDYAIGKPYAKISFDTIQQNFKKGWIIDTDDFWANQLMHPIHGSLTFTAARSMGLNFYESFGYSFLGSLVWEQFLEIQPPSMNDQVNTPFGGSMLGEALFRLSRLVLDSGGYQPGTWRQIFAFLLAPAAGLNRLFFGDRYHGPLLLPPSWIGELHFGAVIAGANRYAQSAPREITVGPWASFAADIIYGVPGTPGLRLDHPFDHFVLSASLALTGDVTAKPTAALSIRGLLIGTTVDLGDQPGGLWGLFSSYDFVAPAVFRVGGFGLGPGASLTHRWGSFELHGTLLPELLPWAGGGNTAPLGVRDYHYGPGADVLLDLRGYFGDRVTARLEGRAYWIGGNYARGESENIAYGKAQVTVRIVGPHGVTASLDWGHRQAHYPDQPDVWQRASIVSVYYTLLQGW